MFAIAILFVVLTFAEALGTHYLQCDAVFAVFAIWRSEMRVKESLFLGLLAFCFNSALAAGEEISVDRMHIL